MVLIKENIGIRRICSEAQRKQGNKLSFEKAMKNNLSQYKQQLHNLVTR